MDPYQAGVLEEPCIESKVKKRPEIKLWEKVAVERYHVLESRCYIGLECWGNHFTQLLHGIRYSLSLTRRRKTENRFFGLESNLKFLIKTQVTILTPN